MGEIEPDPTGSDPAAVTAAVLAATRVLVGIAVRSLDTAGAANGGPAGEKVTLPQFRMLVVLAGHGEIKLVTLADRLGVNPSTAMRMADRLIASRLISREANPLNRRETLIGLTPAGRRVVDEVTGRRRDEIRAIISRMSPEHCQALIAALAAFNAASGEPAATGIHPLGWPEA